jgi:hypothetical protein
LFEPVKYKLLSFSSPCIALALTLVEVDGRDRANGQLKRSIDGLVMTSLDDCGSVEEAEGRKGIETLEVLIDERYYRIVRNERRAFFDRVKGD